MPARLMPAGSGYVARVLLALSLALYAAYVLQLESPASAGTTVLVLASPVRGAILSKSFWRFVGTLVGAVFAVILVAAFGQAPLLFVAGVAVWLGLCTAAATLLQYFRSYAAVLAGYTVTLIAFSVQADPTRIFEVAVARVSVVSVGIMATALVAVVFQPAAAGGPVQARIHAQIAAVAGLAADALAGLDQAALRPLRSRIAATMAALDQTIEYAAAGDYEVARRATGWRLALAELFGALTGALHTGDALHRLALAGGPARAAADELAGVLARLRDLPPDAGGAVVDIEACRARLLAFEHTADLPLIAATHQARDLLDQLAVAIRTADGGAAPAARLRPAVYPATAVRNGVRAALAVALAGLFWIATAWPAGPQMLAMLGPICGLLGTSDSAAKASVGFLQGTAVAVLAAGMVTFGILPHVTAFPTLLMVVLPVLAAGLFATQRPPIATASTAFLIFFFTLLGLTNPIVYDVAGFLNTASAFLVGAACGVLTFRILLPPSAPRDVRQIIAAVRRDIDRLARRRPPSWLSWEHLQHQRVVRMAGRLPPDPAVRAPLLDGVCAGLMVGRELLHIRSAPPLPEADRPVAEDALTALRRLRRTPAAAAEVAQRTARRLADGAAPGSPSLHVAAAFQEIHQLVCDHPEFFAP
jgi:uncharacterized membrane protein YccC